MNNLTQKVPFDHLTNFVFQTPLLVLSLPRRQFSGDTFFVSPVVCVAYT